MTANYHGIEGIETSGLSAIRTKYKRGTTMNNIPETDKLFLVLHRAGWSIGDTAFAGKDGISWLVYGTKDDHSIQVTEIPKKWLGDRLTARLTRWCWFSQSDERS